MTLFRLIRLSWLALLAPLTLQADPLWLAPSELQGGALGYAAPRGTDPVDNFSLGLDLSKVPLEPAADPEPNWFVRLEYGVPSTYALGDIVLGDIDFLDDNESYCLTLGRYVKRDLWGLPLDLSINGSVCFHPENSQQDNIYQYLLWVQLHWTEFPWNDRLRTRIGLGEGFSYVEHIPYSETVRRKGRDSIHLLNYLEFSVSLNLADLMELSRLNRVIPGADSPLLDNAWLVGSLHHRSGGWGLMGTYEDRDGRERSMTGGDNVFAIGVALDF